MPKRSRPPPGATSPKKSRKRNDRHHVASQFIDDEAEEDDDVLDDEEDGEEDANEDEDGAIEDDSESVHSAYSLRARAKDVLPSNNIDTTAEEPSQERADDVAVVTSVEQAVVDPVEAKEQVEPALSREDTVKAPVKVKAPDPVVKKDAKSPEPVVKKEEAMIKQQGVQGRPRLNARIDRMHDFANDDELTYSILRVPADARIIVTDDPVRDRVHVLGRPLKNRPQNMAPVSIWIVGRLSRVYLRDNLGNLPKSVSVNIRPLNSRSFHAATTLLRRHTTDAASVERYDDIRASRWMNVKVPGEYSDRIDSFDAIWDARKALKSPREQMEPMSAADLKKGDLVLLEVSLARYRVTDKSSESTSPNKNKKRHENWAAYFSLKSICMLDDTPVEADPAAAVPVGNWAL